MFEQHRLSKKWLVIVGLLVFLVALRLGEFYLAWNTGDRDGEITSPLLVFSFSVLYIGSIIGFIILAASRSISFNVAVFHKLSDNTVIALLGLLLILGNLFIFEEYIFGNKCLIFLDDRGSDSALLTLLTTYFFTNAHPFGDFWMHESVFGNSVFTFPMLANIFDPFLHLVFFNATVADVAHRMVYYAMLQSTAAGMGLYGFLRRSGRSSTSAIIGAICYAFCGAFTASATWVPVLLLPLLTGLALILWTLKLWQQTHRWYMFTLAAAYFVVSTQAIVTLYQLAVFFMFYLVYEHLASGGAFAPSGLQRVLKRGFKAALAGGIGVLATGIVLFPHLYYMFFENYRFLHDTSSLFRLRAIAVWLRFFSNDLVGTANNLWSEGYYFSNYFEMPFLYSGIIFIFILPLWYLLYGWQLRNRRIMLTLSLLLLPFIIAMGWPKWRSYLFYGGKFTYFRWATVFVVTAIVIAGTHMLDMLFAEMSCMRKRIISFFAAIILVAGLGWTYVSFSQNEWDIFDSTILFFVVGCLMAYCFLLSLPSFPIQKMLLIATVFIELAWQGHHTVTYQRNPLRHATVLNNGYATSNLYAYPPMLKAISYVKQREGNQFFRLSKTRDTFPSLLTNDNSALCQSYYGTKGYTTFNNRFTIAFFLNRKITNSFLGLDLQDRYFLDALVGVKYYLKRGTLEMPTWAKFLTNFDDVEVFSNPQALPFGIVYPQYIWQEKLDEFEADEPLKDAVFLSTAVVTKSPLAEKLLRDSRVELMTTELASLLDDTHIRTSIHDRQRTAMLVTTLSNDLIAGTIDVEHPGLLFFAIPFDPGWHIVIDGKETPTLLVNVGFLGAVIAPGQHAISLSYRPPYYRIGKIISGVVCIFIILAVSVFRKPMRGWMRFA